MAKGQKTGGRKEGTPNKVTQAMRDRLQDVLEGELANLGDLIEEVSARDRLQFIIKLIPFLLPKAEYENEEHKSMEPSFFELVNQQIIKTKKG